MAKDYTFDKQAVITAVAEKSGRSESAVSDIWDALEAVVADSLKQNPSATVRVPLGIASLAVRKGGVTNAALGKGGGKPYPASYQLRVRTLDDAENDIQATLGAPPDAA